MLTCDQIDSPASVKSSKATKSLINGTIKTSLLSDLEIKRRSWMPTKIATAYKAPIFSFVLSDVSSQCGACDWEERWHTGWLTRRKRRQFSSKVSLSSEYYSTSLTVDLISTSSFCLRRGFIYHTHHTQCPWLSIVRSQFRSVWRNRFTNSSLFKSSVDH
jgi:hypothetical protein